MSKSDRKERVWVPGHFTSMKKELGDWTSRLSLCCRASFSAEGWRRSTARVYGMGLRETRAEDGTTLTMVGCVDRKKLGLS